MLCSVFDGNLAEVRDAPWRQRQSRPAPDRARQSAPETSDEAARLQARIEELETLLDRRAKEAWEQGLRAGDAAARESFEEQIRSALGGLAKTAAEMSATRSDTIRRAEADTVRLAIEIARRVLHRELSLDISALEALIKAAIAKLQNQEIFRVRIHPDQEKLMRACLQQAGRAAVEIVADPSLSKGGASFEISRGTLDASVDTQLREIENGLTDEMRRRT
jgi:flagellar assembly protein FliH